MVEIQQAKDTCIDHLTVTTGPELEIMANLQSAAQLIRHAARVKAQAQAQKAVVNMSFPLLLLILPGIFIVLFAPLVIQFINR